MALTWLFLLVRRECSTQCPPSSRRLQPSSSCPPAAKKNILLLQTARIIVESSPWRSPCLWKSSAGGTGVSNQYFWAGQNRIPTKLTQQSFTFAPTINSLPTVLVDGILELFVVPSAGMTVLFTLGFGRPPVAQTPGGFINRSLSLFPDPVLVLVERPQRPGRLFQNLRAQNPVGFRSVLQFQGHGPPGLVQVAHALSARFRQLSSQFGQAFGVLELGFRSVENEQEL